MVVCKTHYPLENFCGASDHGHHVLYTASDSMENFLRLAKSFSLRSFAIYGISYSMGTCVLPDICVPAYRGGYVIKTHRRISTSSSS